MTEEYQPLSKSIRDCIDQINGVGEEERYMAVSEEVLESWSEASREMETIEEILRYKVEKPEISSLVSMVMNRSLITGDTIIKVMRDLKLAIIGCTDDEGEPCEESPGIGDS